MRLPWRRPKLPGEWRPPLAPDERVVAWAATTQDDVVVATNQGLWLPGRGARLRWDEINKAVWSCRQLSVTAARALPPSDGGAEGDPPANYLAVVDEPPVVLTLLDPGDLPDQVRTRVTRSVAYTSHHPLPAGGVRVVGRRVPGRDGLDWRVRYDSGAPPADPATLAAVRALVDQARQSVAAPG